VEEYKRPKFLVQIEKPKGSYKLGDSILVKGTAKAYAGNLVSGAKVKYNVTRYDHWRIWNGNYRKIYPPANKNRMEITFGETTTNELGEFTIRFKAIAEDMDKSKFLSSFDFDISVDVTDINGETRSNTTSLVISKHAIQLSLQIPEKISTDSLKTITISTVNSNELSEPTKVNISISLLESPNRTFRGRLWAQPDTFVMSKNEFYSFFPYDIYKDENKPQTWPKKRTYSSIPLLRQKIDLT